MLVRIIGLAERIAYLPHREPTPAPFGAEDVNITTEDGLTLHGWYFPPMNALPSVPYPAVLHLHGNAGNLRYHQGFSQFLTRHGIGVLMFDYRGYGESDQGSLNRYALMRDAEAALATLTQRSDVDPQRIGIYGVSLGGAFAVPLAAQHKEISALCTLSIFSSWKGIASSTIPLLGPLLMPAGNDSIDQMNGLKHLPWLIVHGSGDPIIPVPHANTLFGAATDAGVDVSIHISQGADHNNILDTHPDAQAAIAEFFVRKLSDTAPSP